MIDEQHTISLVSLHILRLLNLSSPLSLVSLRTRDLQIQTLDLHYILKGQQLRMRDNTVLDDILLPRNNLRL